VERFVDLLAAPFCPQGAKGAGCMVHKFGAPSWGLAQHQGLLDHSIEGAFEGALVASQVMTHT